jgi:replicative DNA helicase
MFKDPKTGQLPPPQLSDLKESGTIEEESGQVLLLSEMSTEPGTNVCTLMGELAKNRFGECTKLGIEFDRATATFKEAACDEQGDNH